MSKSKEIIDRVPDDYEKTPGYLIHDFTEAVGQVMDQQDFRIEEVKRKQQLDNLEGEELKLYVKERKGIVAREATFARGQIEVTGNGKVRSGDLFETKSGVQFKALNGATIEGTGMIPIVALIAGNSGVVGSHSITEIPVTIEGITGCDNSAPTRDGFDAETDESIRQRFLIALQTPVSSGNKASYKNWALEVPGVGDAKVYPLQKGPLTVEVVIIDAKKKPASEELVQQVQAHIDPGHTGRGDGKAPIGAQCYVSAAADLKINISVKITSETLTQTAKESITAAITEYLESIAFTGKEVSYAHIGNAILNAEGVTDYEHLTVNGKTENVPVPEMSVATMGELVLTDV